MRSDVTLRHFNVSIMNMNKDSLHIIGSEGQDTAGLITDFVQNSFQERRAPEYQ